MDPFDLLVIGGGPGGYLCAERAAQGGMKVCLFEGRRIGGTCLNEGCIPTKTLLNSAKLYRHAKDSAAFGVTAENVTFDQAKVIERKDKVVKSLVAGVEKTMRTLGIAVVIENGKIAGRSAGVFHVTAGGETYTGTRLAVASGAQSDIPPIPGLKEALASGFAVTSREILDRIGLPRELVVVGGGVVGLELACYFATVGVKVTVIEMLPKIAGNTDPEICKVIADAYKKSLTVKTSCRVTKIGKDGVVFEEKGEEKEIKCDLVLLNVGRRPFTRDLGLETLGVETHRGAIVTDRHLCTNVAGVYAIGDCNGKSLYAHTAYREAEVAVNHMLGKADEMRYHVVPAVLYTDPEAACVGESKASAEEKGLHVKEVRLSMNFAGRYLAEVDRGRGFIKLIVDKDTHRVLGCHMVGSYVSEFILSAAMMVDAELPIERLQKLVFPHPTVCEVIREALFQVKMEVT